MYPFVECGSGAARALPQLPGIFSEARHRCADADQLAKFERQFPRRLWESSPSSGDILAPMDFDERAFPAGGVMAARNEATGREGHHQFRETADARMLAISADQPVATNPYGIFFARRAVEAGNAGAPTNETPSRRGAIDQQFAAGRCDTCKRGFPRKWVVAEETVIRETNSGKRSGRCGIEIDGARPLTLPLLRRQEPFSPSFIDWGCAGIDGRNAQALRPAAAMAAAGPCGAASDDRHVSV